MRERPAIRFRFASPYNSARVVPLSRRADAVWPARSLTAFIEINGLTKRFGTYTAVQDVSLTIAEREFVTFLGPSGCGKTTTLRMIAGFVAPDSGTIQVAGRMLSSPSEVAPPEQRRMGMVFQNYAI